MISYFIRVLLLSDCSIKLGVYKTLPFFSVSKARFIKDVKDGNLLFSIRRELATRRKDPSTFISNGTIRRH